MITKDLALAANKLQSGDVVGMPTETVYGLAAGIHLPEAIKKVFVLKKRPYFDPLIVHLADVNELSEVVNSVPDIALELGKIFWPGPLTMVLPKKADLNPMITSGLETVGVRIPNHPMALKLIRSANTPLAAPSANLFSKLSPTRPEHVDTAFPDITVLDGGPCEVGIESTVISFGPNKIIIHRPGAISESQLNEFLNKTHRTSWTTIKAPSAASPGQIKHHYMPEIPLVILPIHTMPDSPSIKEKVITSFPDFYIMPGEMTLPNDATLASRLLYEELRQKSKGASGLWFSPRPEQLKPEWDALWDRLNKAASLKI